VRRGPLPVPGHDGFPGPAGSGRHGDSHAGHRRHPLRRPTTPDLVPGRPPRPARAGDMVGQHQLRLRERHPYVRDVHEWWLEEKAALGLGMHIT